MKYQPISEDPNSVLNLMRYRPLEGFIASVTPFNFTAIAGNLAYTPCIMVTQHTISWTKKLDVESIRRSKYKDPIMVSKPEI